jgi:DNA-binding beta-propeller fold protein YncE
VTADSATAYVAVMGSTDIAIIDLETFDVTYLEDVGSGPRHLNLDPEDRYLYASLNSSDRLVKIDLESSEIVATVSTGDAPRSMVLSDDGSALYVVNYNSDTMSKVRTSDMVEIEEHHVNDKPIGITYDGATREVWVSAYSGTIEVFTDRAPVGSG